MVASSPLSPDGEPVQITIDRSKPGLRADTKFVFLTGRDAQAREVIVKLEHTAWEGIQAEWPSDPLAGVEAVALHGHWRVYRGQRVWRVDFI